MKFLVLFSLFLGAFARDALYLSTNTSASIESFSARYRTAVNVRELPGFILIISREMPSSRQNLSIPHEFKKLDIPHGQVPFLISVEEILGDKVKEAFQWLETNSKIYLREGMFRIISVSHPDDLADFDQFAASREILKFVRVRSPSKINISAPTVSDAKDDIIDLIDGEEYLLKVKQLSGGLPFYLDGKEITVQTRYSGSQGNTYTSQFLYDWFEGLGYQVETQSFRAGSRNTQNIIGKKIGTTYPNQIVVVGGHYDSTSEKASSVAPGAVDDGSGTAGVMHLAEIFSTIPTERTIYFVAFSGEEQGMIGSYHFVSVAEQKRLDITNALIMDMISYYRSYFGVIVEGVREYNQLITLSVANLKEYGGSGFSVTSRTDSWGSDHVPFQEGGIPAILAIERDETNYPYYHDSRDTWQNTDVDLSVRIIKGVAATLIDLVGLA